MDKNVTKEGLMKLKKSKPIPITAHTGEIIVPCVYTEVVGDFMKKKGIHLPLDTHKLAELRRVAKAMPEKEEYARGTRNLKRKKKRLGKKTVQIKGSNIVGGPISSNEMISIKIGQPKPRASRPSRPVKREEIRLPPPLLPDSDERGFNMIRPPNFNLIRPFSTSAPNGNQAVPIQPHPDSLLHQKQQEERNLKLLTDESKEHLSNIVQESHKFYQRQLVDYGHRISEVAGYIMENFQPRLAYESSTSSSSFETPNPFVTQKTRIDELNEHKYETEEKEEKEEKEDAEKKIKITEEHQKKVKEFNEKKEKEKKKKEEEEKKKEEKKEEEEYDLSDEEPTPEDPGFSKHWKDLQRDKRITRKMLSAYTVKDNDNRVTTLRKIARQGLGIMFNMTPEGKHYTKEPLIKLILDSQR